MIVFLVGITNKTQSYKARIASDLIQFRWLDTYDVFWKTLWMKRSLKQPFGTFI